MKSRVIPIRRAAATLLAATILSGAIPGAPADAAGRAASREAKSAAREASSPFARVYLALRGCTSCAHCRTSIRQMVRSSAQGAETKLSEDRVEVRYTTPRSVPLRDVIRSLARNRLHDMSVVDVLFEATGTLGVGKDGRGRFVIADTGQSFPISVQGVRLPSSGASVRVVALVEGWRDKGSLSLVAREVKNPA